MKFKALAFYATALSTTAAAVLSGCSDRKTFSDKQIDSIRAERTYVIDTLYQDTECYAYTLKTHKRGMVGEESKKNLRIEFYNPDATRFRDIEKEGMQQVISSDISDEILVSKEGQEFAYEHTDMDAIEYILEEDQAVRQEGPYQDKNMRNFLRTFFDNSHALDASYIQTEERIAARVYEIN